MPAFFKSNESHVFAKALQINSEIGTT